ncbi:MAG: substrate-binding domain-containing protein [Spirochaetota bacterium]
MRKAFVVLMAVAVAVMVAAPLSAQPKGKDLKIVYVCKMLTHPWFQAEQKGAMELANKYGITYIGIDANLDDEAFMQGIDSAIAQKATGVAFCITDVAMGPAVTDKLKAAKIPYVTINDNVKDSAGKDVPNVGIDTYGSCFAGGKAMADLATKRGFFKKGNVVKIMSVDVSFKSFLHERTVGYQDGIIKNSGGFLTKADIVAQDNETGMFEQVLPVAQAIIHSHPEVTHWLITGLNDDSGVAPLRALEEAGFNMNNVIACGLGGYSLSSDEFRNGNKNYITIKLQPETHGSEAVRALYEFITKKTPIKGFIPTSGAIVGFDTWTTYTWD